MDTEPFGICEADSRILLEAFESSGLFRENTDLLNGLRAISKVVRLGTGSDVLIQGEKNACLYVLLNGRVQVYVDGAVVAHLEQRGDFIGEMGVISGQPNSATVVTSEDCEFLCIDIENPMEGAVDPRVRQALYGLFARALANKLVITNDRAKRFERTSEDLKRAYDALHEANAQLEQKVSERTVELQQKGDELEAQNAELGASMRKLEELVLHKDTTFKSLNSLCKDHLEPLQVLLAKPESDMAAMVATRRFSARVGEVLDHLRPMTDLYNSEVTLRNKRVLLAENNNKLQRIAKIALLGTGVDLDILPDDADGSALLNRNYDIVLTDLAHLDMVAAAQEQNPDMEVVFMTPHSVEVYLDEIGKRGYLANIVSCNVEDREFTTKNILTTVSKILNREIFGLEKYMLWGVEVEEQTLGGSADRKGVLNGMSAHLESFGIGKRIISRTTLVCEELLMNAIYDAPVDDSGKALFNHLSRRESVVLPQDDLVTLRYACDGVLLAISVNDPYGSLERDTVLRYLASCYEGRAGELNLPEERGGAGRGLHQIVESSDLTVFNVCKGLRTEAIALFSLATIANTTRTHPSFHFFTA